MSKRRVLGLVVLLLALGGCARDVDDQLRRVMKDGQECIVVERRYGRIDAVDCDWSGR